MDKMIPYETVVQMVYKVIGGCETTGCTNPCSCAAVLRDDMLINLEAEMKTLDKQ